MSERLGEARGLALGVNGITRDCGWGFLSFGGGMK